jgi:hypothetical protein
MRAAVVLALAILVGGCLRTTRYQCARADQCDLAGAVGRCEPNNYCSTADGSCTSGFRWASSAPEAGACVEVPDAAGAAVDAATDAPVDAAPYPVNECVVQSAIPATASTCAAEVCALDARCCTREWSDQCVHLVERQCGKSCSQRLALIGDGMLRVQQWDGSKFVTEWSHAVALGDATADAPALAAVTWGDIDGDLKPDLISCVEGGDAQIWKNGGTCGETFCPIATVVANGCQQIACIDADHDGDLDVVMGGAYRGGLWINDGGLFGATIDVFNGYINAGMDWADLDGDGILDLALAQYGGPATVERMTLGTPPGPVTFAPLWTDPPAGNTLDHVRVTFGDVDHDGVLDLLSTGAGFVHVWRNTSTTGGFTSTTAPYWTTTTYGSAASTLADVDKDGDLDLVEVLDTGRVRLTRNNLTEGLADKFTLTPLWESADDFGDSRIAVGDVDGDHQLDIVVGTWSNTLTTTSSVYLARPGPLWKFGTAADKPNAVDADHLRVRDVALGPAP